MDIGIWWHTNKPTWKLATRANFIIVYPYNHPTAPAHTVACMLKPFVPYITFTLKNNTLGWSNVTELDFL